MKQHGLYYELVASQEGSVNQEDIAELGNQNSTAVLTDEITFLSTTLNEESTESSPTRPSLNKNSVSEVELPDKNDSSQDLLMWRVIKMNQPEWGYMVLGVVGAVILGLSTPIYAIVFGEIMGLLDQSLDDDVYHLNNIYAFVSLVLLHLHLLRFSSTFLCKT